MCVKHAEEQGTFKVTSAWISPTEEGALRRDARAGSAVPSSPGRKLPPS